MAVAYGVCDLPNTIHADKKDKEFEVIAYASDDQGLDTRLKTGKDFGCNRFIPT